MSCPGCRRKHRLGWAVGLLCCLSACSPAPDSTPAAAPAAVSMSNIEARIAEGDFSAALRMFRDLPPDEKLKPEVQARWTYVAERNSAATAPDRAQALIRQIIDTRTPALSALTLDGVNDLPGLFAVQDAIESQTRFLAENGGDDLKPSMTPAQEKAFADFKALIAEKQTTALPQMRVKFADLAGRGLWPRNVDVEVRGPGSRELVLTGPNFTDRAEIARLFDVTRLDLVKLRFAKVHFRPSASATDQWTYDLVASGDEVLGLSAEDGIRPLQ